MRKNRSILMIAGLLTGLASCQKSGQYDLAEAGKSFYATIQDETRVYADEDLHVRWDADDRISVFDKFTLNEQYRFTGETGANAGWFEIVPHGGFAVGTVLSEIYAVYPYRENTSIRGDIGAECVLTVELPAEQAYRKASFGPGANLMVSMTKDSRLQFRNAVGYLVLKFHGAGVKVTSVTLRGNDGEMLAGRAEVIVDSEGKPSLKMLPGGKQEVTLVCKDPVVPGVTPEEATEFWFALPPLTFRKGFTVEVAGSDGVVAKHYTERMVTLERNRKVTMASLGLGGGSISIDKEPMYRLATVSGGESGEGEIKWDFFDGDRVHVLVSGYRCRCQTLDHIGFHLTRVDLKIPRFLMMEIPLERRMGDEYISKNEQVAGVHLNRYGLSENGTHLEFDLSITLSRETQGDIRIVYSGPVK